MQKLGATPPEMLALVPYTLPLELTFTKLLEEPERGDRSHHQAATIYAAHSPGTDLSWEVLKPFPVSFYNALYKSYFVANKSAPFG